MVPEALDNLDTQAPALGDAAAAHESYRRERKTRFMRGAMSGVAVRVVGIGTQVLALGLAVRYLGRERYGMWAAISTFVAWFSMANLGLGHGLIARLAAASARDDRDAARRYISSALAVITLTAGALLAGLLVVGWTVPWSRVFNVTDPLAVAEARPVVLVAGMLTIVCLPLGISASVLFGYQRADVSNVLMLVGSVVGLVLLVLGVRYQVSMPVLAAALMAGPVFAALAQFAWAVSRGLLTFSPRAVNYTDAVSLLSLGMGFLALQLAGIVVFEAGALLIAQRFGAAEVTPYAVTNRTVMILLSFCIAVLGPLWPAYGEAYSRGDLHWVRRAFWKSAMVIVGVWIPAALVLWFEGDTIIRIWAGPAAVPSRVLMGSMLLFALAQGLGLVVSYPLNGIGKLWSQIVGGTLMALLYVPLVLLLFPKVGVAGVALSQAILMFAIALPLAFGHALRLIYAKKPRDKTSLGT